jgi:hypothetical protein
MIAKSVTSEYPQTQTADAGRANAATGPSKPFTKIRERQERCPVWSAPSPSSLLFLTEFWNLLDNVARVAPGDSLTIVVRV